MKQFQCDICGLLVGEYKLHTLYDRLKIQDSDGITIEHVCVECNEQIAKAQTKIDTALRPLKTSWIKQIIMKMRWKKYSQE